METVIKPIKITRKNFTEFGDLISSESINPIDINAGYAKRFDNLANINTSKDGGKTIVSIKSPNSVKFFLVILIGSIIVSIIQLSQRL